MRSLKNNCQQRFVLGIFKFLDTYLQFGIIEIIIITKISKIESMNILEF